MRKLKLGRFIVARLRFMILLRKRKAAAAIIIAAFRYYRFRVAYAVIKEHTRLVRKIQKLYKRFKVRMLARRMAVINNMKKVNVAHCVLFGERRALKKILAKDKRSAEERNLGVKLMLLRRMWLRKKRIAAYVCKDILI